MTDEHGFDHTFGHQDGKSQEIQANQGVRQAFVIPCQPAQPVEDLTQAVTAREDLRSSSSNTDPRSPTPRH
jgi:hypothetical protein